MSGVALAANTLLERMREMGGNSAETTLGWRNLPELVNYLSNQQLNGAIGRNGAGATAAGGVAGGGVGAATANAVNGGNDQGQGQQRRSQSGGPNPSPSMPGFGQVPQSFGPFPPSMGSAFGGVLAQTPAPFGTHPGMWSPWAPGYAGGVMGSNGFAAGPSPFQFPGQGGYGGAFDPTFGSMQEHATPHAAGLGRVGGMAGMSGMDPSLGYGPRPPPLVRKGQEKDAGGKTKKSEKKTAGERVTGPNNPRPTIPIKSGVPEGIPKGLEILAMIDRLKVSQEVEPLEALANAFGIGYEGNNSYSISSGGKHIYQATEDTNFLWRCFCTQLRPVHMRINDQTGNQVLAFERHFRLFPCAWFEPCRENVTVFLGNKDANVIIGRVTQPCCGGCCEPQLNVLDERGKRVLIVKGPCIVTDCCGTKFQVLTDKHKPIGHLQKQGPRNLSDIVKEITTDADEFSILFPPDLKVETKASLLVALFIIDLLFFEFGGNTNRNLDGSCTVDLCVIYCCGCPLPCRITLNGIGSPGDKGTGGAPEAANMYR